MYVSYLDLWEFRQLDENVEKESVGLKLVEKLDNMWYSKGYVHVNLCALETKYILTSIFIPHKTELMRT